MSSLKSLNKVWAVGQVASRFPGIMFDAITGPLNQELGNNAPTSMHLAFVQNDLDLVLKVVGNLQRRRRRLETLALVKAFQEAHMENWVEPMERDWEVQLICRWIDDLGDWEGANLHWE